MFDGYLSYRSRGDVHERLGKLIFMVLLAIGLACPASKSWRAGDSSGEGRGRGREPPL